MTTPNFVMAAKRHKNLYICQGEIPAMGTFVVENSKFGEVNLAIFLHQGTGQANGIDLPEKSLVSLEQFAGEPITYVAGHLGAHWYAFNPADANTRFDFLELGVGEVIPAPADGFFFNTVNASIIDVEIGNPIGLYQQAKSIFIKERAV